MLKDESTPTKFAYVNCSSNFSCIPCFGI